MKSKHEWEARPSSVTRGRFEVSRWEVGGRVAIASCRTELDAMAIATALNSRADLLAALGEVVTAETARADAVRLLSRETAHGNVDDFAYDWLPAARAAIAQATGD